MSGTRSVDALRATDHYIWRTSDGVGRGAFGEVFRGRHKVTGEAVALKVFNVRVYNTDKYTRECESEAELLKNFDHPNIVKLIDVQTEHDSKSKVIVLELAIYGSVHGLLETSQYAFGFDDDEFLLMLTHLVAALVYLRDTWKIIHRDVKPSNILKTIADDGRTLYKLCDFGAAKQCPENGEFKSICGTPEYLHPKIFNRAFIGDGQSLFPATCDLWSIGATLYQNRFTNNQLENGKTYNIT